MMSKITDIMISESEVKVSYLSALSINFASKLNTVDKDNMTEEYLKCKIIYIYKEFDYFEKGINDLKNGKINL